jgi:hypothetical protein
VDARDSIDIGFDDLVRERSATTAHSEVDVYSRNRLTVTVLHHDSNRCLQLPSRRAFLAIAGSGIDAAGHRADGRSEAEGPGAQVVPAPAAEQACGHGQNDRW